MEIIRLSSDTLPPTDTECAVALGFFDGMHRGHRALLKKTVSVAAERRLASAVLTFDSVYKSGAPRLCDTYDRICHFADADIDYVFLCDFEQMRFDSPDYFVTETLTRICRAKVALCGFNFRFGAGAAGDAALLGTLMRSCGGDTVVLPPLSLSDGTLISSSAIRAAVERGDMSYAAALLGRPFSIDTPVEHGKALGRTLGFPTINQFFPPLSVIPAYGVYAVCCTVDSEVHLGVANVGVRPTVDGNNPNCETHILGYTGDLYDLRVRVEFLEMLRPERRFDSVEALKQQIENDKQEVEKRYGNRMDQIDSAWRT